MENCYIGDDGKDYHSYESLKQANRKRMERMVAVIPVNQQALLILKQDLKKDIKQC